MLSPEIHLSFNRFVPHASHVNSSCQTTTLILLEQMQHILWEPRWPEMESSSMWCALGLGPPSPLPFNFPRPAACGGGYALLSQLALRCAALLLPSFVKETRRRSAPHSSHPCSLSLMQMESRSDLFLPLSSFSLSFIRSFAAA